MFDVVKSSAPKLLSLGMALILMLFFFPCQALQTGEKQRSFASYLLDEKSHLLAAIKQIKTEKLPNNLAQYSQQKKYWESLAAINQTKINSLEGFLDNQNAEQTRLTLKLKHLQQLPLPGLDKSMQEKVLSVERLIAANKATYEYIADDLDLAHLYQNLLQEQLDKLENWLKNFKFQAQLVRIKQARAQLLDTLQSLYKSKVGTKTAKSTAPMSYETWLLLNNQQISLVQHALMALHLQRTAVRSQIALLENNVIKTLQHTTDTHGDLLKQYSKLTQALDQMNAHFLAIWVVPLDKNQRVLKTSLHKEIKSQLQLANAQKQQIEKSWHDYQAQLKKMLSTRQSLAEYSLDSWPVIAKKIAAIPNLFKKYMKNLGLKVWDSYLWLEVIPTLLLWFVMVGVLGLLYMLNRFLKSLIIDKERSRLAGYLYDGSLTILQRNIPYLAVVIFFGIVFYATNIAYANYQLLTNLLVIWLTFRVLLLIARLVLLERVSDDSGKDVTLYYRIKWLLLFGGWAAALMTFSHLLPLSVLLQDLFNRLFMFFLLCCSFVAWRSKDVIPYLLKPLLKGKKRYVINAISLLIILVPITVFTTAIIGLLGFINLAWTLSLYQAYTLMVLVLYILSRGLLFDALESISEWMIASLNNGWLWIEVFLKPLDKVLRLVLIVVGVFLLFQCFGWHSDSLVIIGLGKFAHYPLIHLPGVHITVASLLVFLVLLALFVWAAKWTREFCYRWLYKNTKDVGIRNSLSIFTQYAVIISGGVIALHVLGLDFSGMSMILGGLAVGMGFGLRDFANNIVGGLMLLIERPVREGDLITIGEYEGEVAHIGIRSMRVTSSDNTEVLIPNAETFNKPFINWTHQDNIVRTAIPIKVSRIDDPVIVQQLILDVLAIIPEIVSSPPVQVFLKKIDEALIEFEVRFFINVQTHSRVEVRSKVLFAITAQFKAAGIHPPVDPITVEIKEGLGEFFSKNDKA